MQELIERLREEVSLQEILDAVTRVASDAENLIISQRDEIRKYKALCDQMGNALARLNRFASAQVCEHTETYRGGAIWEICRQCGAKWADDEGGKPNFVEPVVLTNAIAALEAWRTMK